MASSCCSCLCHKVFQCREGQRSPLARRVCGLGTTVWGGGRCWTLRCAGACSTLLLFCTSDLPHCLGVQCHDGCQVLDTLVYAERELLRQRPELAAAQVYVHFQSSVQVSPDSGRRCLRYTCAWLAGDADSCEEAYL